MRCIADKTEYYQVLRNALVYHIVNAIEKLQRPGSGANYIRVMFRTNGVSIIPMNYGQTLNV